MQETDTSDGARPGDEIGRLRRWPVVAVVPAHHALEGLQHRFDWDWVVEHRERAVAKCLGEDSVALGRVDLTRADDNRRRRSVEAAQELEDTRAGLNGARGLRVGAARVHGDREVDHGDVYFGAADDVGDLVARLGAQTLDAEAVEEDRELVGEGVLAPTAVGEQQVETPRVRGGAVI